MKLAEEQVERLQALRLSRRRLMVLGSTAALGLLVTACGGDDDDDDAPTATSGTAATTTASSGSDEATPTSGSGGEATATVASAASPTPSFDDDETPQYGGVLTLTQTEDPPNFDVHQGATLRVVHPMAPCYDQLIQINPLDWSELIPDLADSWEVSDDGVEITFVLKQGVKFHHGKDFKSEDVKATFDIVRNPPEGFTSPRRSLFATVDEITTPDDNTAVFVLSRPTASLITNLSSNYMPVYPKDILDEKGSMKDDVSGTGAFKLKSYTEGNNIEIERNPDYHVEGLPYLDGLKWFFIPDVNTALASLISGQVLGFSTETPGDVTTAERQMGDEVSVAKIHVLSANSLEMNSEREPWGNPLVRRAAWLAIDRYAAIDLLTNGEGVIAGAMFPFGPWALPEGELEGKPGYARDKTEELAEAKALMEEAGFANGFDSSILTRNGQEDIAIFLADQLGKIGIRVTLDVTDFATYGERTAAFDFDLLGTSQGYTLDDPDAIFAQAYLCGAGRNYGQLCIDGLDEIFLEQSQELDYEKRKLLVNDMDRLVMDNISKVALGYRVSWYLRHASVRNYERNASQYVNEKHTVTWLKQS